MLTHREPERVGCTTTMLMSRHALGRKPASKAPTYRTACTATTDLALTCLPGLTEHLPQGGAFTQKVHAGRY
jgi:hypothetical protein